MQIAEYGNDDHTLIAKIHLKKETFSIEFFKENNLIGEIEYPDKSMEYVEDAASNFVDGIFKVEDVKRYL